MMQRGHSEEHKKRYLGKLLDLHQSQDQSHAQGQDLLAVVPAQGQDQAVRRGGILEAAETTEIVEIKRESENGNESENGKGSEIETEEIGGTEETEKEKEIGETGETTDEIAGKNFVAITLTRE